MNLRLIALAVTFLVVSTNSFFAWDGTGHMIIEQIAYDQLNTKAKAKVEALAKQLDHYGVPYNAVNIACWADDIKHAGASVPHHGNYKYWHFIDLGCDAADPDLIANPPSLTIVNGEIVTALNHCVAVMKGGNDPLIPNETIALALVIHLVGDIHQPLHCTTHYYHHAGGAKTDIGGNSIIVSNLVNAHYNNLHTFWDEAYRRSYSLLGKVGAAPEISHSAQPSSPELTAWESRLKKYAPKNPQFSTDFVAWAKETHALGCQIAYGKLTDPIETSPIILRSAYVRSANRVASEQIVLAGWRLAQLLNDLYK